MKKAQIKDVKLDDITPYWRNPRDNSLAVQKVKQSILEYGFNQPIAVDGANIIVAGHTRYMALGELVSEGHSEFNDVKIIQLDLTQEQSKAYRIIDNKTQEYSKWTDDLFVEIRSLENVDVMKNFFNTDIVKDLEKSTGVDFKEVTLEEINKTEAKMKNLHQELVQRYQDGQKETICPSCGEEFMVG